VVEGADGAPTRQSYQVFDELSQELAGRLERLQQILDTDLDEFNRLLRSRNLEPLAAAVRRPAQE
jgi:hypothetical protein